MRAEQARALLNDGRARLLLGQIEQALARAEATGLEVTRAEIECNLGNLELFQGHYDRVSPVTEIPNYPGRS